MSDALAHHLEEVGQVLGPDVLLAALGRHSNGLHQQRYHPLAIPLLNLVYLYFQGRKEKHSLVQCGRSGSLRFGSELISWIRIRNNTWIRFHI